MVGQIQGVSVILLTHDHAQLLPRFFANLAACQVLEVLVCDYESSDETVAIARDAGAHIFRGGKELAHNINNAAKYARGSILCFLLPACSPPEEAADYMLWSLADTGAKGGYFPLRIVGEGLAGWWNSRRLNLAASFSHKFSFLHGPFMWRHIFESVGAFPAGERDPSLLLQRVRREGKLITMDDAITCFRK